MPDTGSSITQGMKVGIVGGSIAGCAAALELLRAGCEVTIFERSQRKLRERGAGIGFPAWVLEKAKERDLIDADFPCIISETVPIIVRSETEKDQARVLWEMPFRRTLISWQTLYNNLRRRVPADAYHADCEVTALGQEGSDRAFVQLSDGRKLVFDLVVCGDGYKSIGRSALFPDITLDYAGYIAWRGYLEERFVSQPDFFFKRSILSFHDRGHCVIYFVPGGENGGGDGARMMNWVWYERVSEQELPRMLTDNSGHTHPHSIPHGSATPWHLEHLRSRARALLPAPIASVIEATAKPFIQTIFDMQLPTYHQGRICLLGDSSSTVRPHTAGGTPKALRQAISLSESLACNETLESALSAWSEKESASVGRLMKAGKRMGGAMVLNTPPWDEMDERATQKWWDDEVRGARPRA